MRIERIRASGGTDRPATGQRHGKQHDPAPKSRAVAPTAPTTERVEVVYRDARPFAPFLAHLVATRLDLPQTRVRRRASPAEAEMSYATVSAVVHNDDLPAGFFWRYSA